MRVGAAKKGLPVKDRKSRDLIVHIYTDCGSAVFALNVTYMFCVFLCSVGIRHLVANVLDVCFLPRATKPAQQ